MSPTDDTHSSNSHNLTKSSSTFRPPCPTLCQPVSQSLGHGATGRKCSLTGATHRLGMQVSGTSSASIIPTPSHSLGKNIQHHRQPLVFSDGLAIKLHVNHIATIISPVFCFCSRTDPIPPASSFSVLMMLLNLVLVIAD